MIQLNHAIRNHLLAATMNKRWETLTEIVRALRKDGTPCLRAEVWEIIRALSEDGIHMLAWQTREGSGEKEYRLHVNAEKVGRVPQSMRRVQAKPMHFPWPGTTRKR
jgi:hypothetical protein